jgi:hypothetical protein
MGMLITCLNIVAANDFNYAQALHSADCVPIAHFLKGTLSHDSVHFLMNSSLNLSFLWSRVVFHINISLSSVP